MPTCPRTRSRTPSTVALAPPPAGGRRDGPGQDGTGVRSDAVLQGRVARAHRRTLVPQASARGLGVRVLPQRACAVISVAAQCAGALLRVGPTIRINHAHCNARRLTWAAALYDWLRITEDRVACILTGAGAQLAACTACRTPLPPQSHFTHIQPCRPARPAPDVGRALAREFDALVISYDLFAKCAPDLEQRRFKVVVLDEAHCIKNTKVGAGRIGVMGGRCETRHLQVAGGRVVGGRAPGSPCPLPVHSCCRRSRQARSGVASVCVCVCVCAAPQGLLR